MKCVWMRHHLLKRARSGVLGCFVRRILGPSASVAFLSKHAPRCASCLSLWHESRDAVFPRRRPRPLLNLSSLERSQLKFSRLFIPVTLAIVLSGCRSYAERAHGEDLLVPASSGSRSSSGAEAASPDQSADDDEETPTIRFEDAQKSSEVELRYPSFGDPILERLIERGLRVFLLCERTRTRCAPRSFRGRLGGSRRRALRSRCPSAGSSTFMVVSRANISRPRIWRARASSILRRCASRSLRRSLR